MADITLFELHPAGDVQVGPKSLRGSKSETTTSLTEPAAGEPTTNEGGGSKLSLLLSILFIGFLVFAALKVLSEDSEDELAELDET